MHTPPTLPKTPWILATIKSKFNFKNIFSDIVYNVKKINLTLPKIGIWAPQNPPLVRESLQIVAADVRSDFPLLSSNRQLQSIRPPGG